MQLIGQKGMIEHLAKRGVHDPNLYILREYDLAVFQLWDMTGQLFGYCNYRWYGDKGSGRNNYFDGKYFIRTIKPTSWFEDEDGLVKVIDKSYQPYWGLHSWNNSNELYVVEGLFDAARIIETGKSAMAVFSNDPKKHQELKLWKKVRPIVTVCDGDKAGMKLAKYGHKHIILPDDRDANDYSVEELKGVLGNGVF